MARESRCQLPNAFPSINLPFGILFSENHLISVEFLMTLHFVNDRQIWGPRTMLLSCPMQTQRRQLLH